MICAALPFVLLLCGVAAGGSGRSQLAVTAWVVAMFGALIPAVYVTRSSPDDMLMQWRFMVTFGVAYFAVLIVFCLWLAKWTAWVPPTPGALPAVTSRLQQRVHSLADAGLDVRVEQAPDRPDQLFVTRDFRDGKRALRVRLTFVEARHCVLAREMSLIRGDKPMNASEAQMTFSRRVGDGTHPDADLLYDASLTVTLPDEAIRRRIGLRVTHDGVEITGDQATASAPQNLPHVLTELVNQSGWTWQGVFGNWQGGGN